MNWWRRLLQRERVERQLDAELRDHFERMVADDIQSGATESEARRRARLAFGGMEQVKEDCRDVRGTRWLDEMAQDLRYGLRILRRSPAFTLVAVTSLALGIGANSAIFALVDGVLLKSLPVREPQRLVMVDDGSWTNPIWEQLRDRQHEWADGALAWSDTRFDLSRGGATEFVEGMWASGGFFDVLGVPAVLGRTFSVADDQRSGGPDGPVAVISYAFWQRRFGGEASVVGRTLTLDRVAFTIVGVTPPSFLGPSPGRSFDVAVPIGTQAIVQGPRNWLDARSTWVLEVMARLKPGQTADQATAALRAIQPQVREATLPERWPPPMLEQYLRDGLTLVPAAAGPAGFRTRYEQPLRIIMAVVVLVLLIACANIANLMLARASGRRHELTMRLALGASRFRIVRQLLVESLLLAVRGSRPRTDVRAVGEPSHRRSALDAAKHGRARPVARLARRRIHRAGRGRDGAAVWNRAGPAHPAGRSDRSAQGAVARLCRRGPARVRRAAAGRAGRVDAGPGRRRGPVHAHVRQARDSGHRPGSRCCARRGRRCHAQFYRRGRPPGAPRADPLRCRRSSEGLERQSFADYAGQRFRMERADRAAGPSGCGDARAHVVLQQRDAWMVRDDGHEAAGRA